MITKMLTIENEELIKKIKDNADAANQDVETYLDDVVKQSYWLTRLDRLLQFVMEHNEKNVNNPNNQYCITPSLLYEISHLKYRQVRPYYDKHKEKIENHNQKHNLGRYDNRGKLPFEKAAGINGLDF